MSLSIVIADDHATFVRTLTVLLQGAGFDVVGTAGDGATAVERCLELQPDVVLMDLSMPVLDGVAATAQIADSAPHIGVLMLTMFEDEDSLVAALQAGARGYLVKGARHDEVLHAIRTVHQGGLIVGPGVARRLRALVHHAPSSTTREALGLTAREQEVLEALAQGLDNAAIARRLHLGEKTVRNYVSMIFAKLHASSRAEAVVKARDAGYGLPPS
jgi:DNA-binding NarL/FixJ family response regulator